MKSKLNFLFLISIFLIIISACSNQPVPLDTTVVASSEIEKLLLKQSQSTDETISKVSLEYSEILDFGDYYSFLCESEKKIYEGIAIISNREVKKIDLAEHDVNAAFTVHTFSGSIKNSDNSKSLYFACSGTINDDNIVKLHVFLSGDIMYEIQVGDRNTYDIVIADNQPTILKIDAIDKNDVVIYSYPPYPPENAA